MFSCRYYIKQHHKKHPFYYTYLLLVYYARFYINGSSIFHPHFCRLLKCSHIFIFCFFLFILFLVPAGLQKNSWGISIHSHQFQFDIGCERYSICIWVPRYIAGDFCVFFTSLCFLLLEIIEKKINCTLAYGY